MFHTCMETADTIDTNEGRRIVMATRLNVYGVAAAVLVIALGVILLYGVFTVVMFPYGTLERAPHTTHHYKSSQDPQYTYSTSI